MTGKKRVGVLISGRGSNLKALIDACAHEDFPAQVVMVISNKADAPGLQFAKSANIPSQIIEHKAYETREDFDTALQDVLQDAGVELLCGAGFMRLLTDEFVDAWRDRMLNIHPSLLPSFKGINVHQRVLESGARISGCTVHFVRSEMDSGPIIAQAAVPVLMNDTPETLADRILVAEHQLYPMALRLVASGAVRVVAERVVQSDASLHAADKVEPLISPQLSKK